MKESKITAASRVCLIISGVLFAIFAAFVEYVYFLQIKYLCTAPHPEYGSAVLVFRGIEKEEIPLIIAMVILLMAVVLAVVRYFANHPLLNFFGASLVVASVVIWLTLDVDHALFNVFFDMFVDVPLNVFREFRHWIKPILLIPASLAEISVIAVTVLSLFKRKTP